LVGSEQCPNVPCPSPENDLKRFGSSERFQIVTCVLGLRISGALFGMVPNCFISERFEIVPAFAGELFGTTHSIYVWGSYF